MKKGLVYLGLSIAASIFIGCGSGDLDSSKITYNPDNIFDQVVIRDIDYKDYNVTAVDDPIIGATVEAAECNSSVENGNGTYTLKGCVSKPSYISISNGIIVTKDGNLTQSFPLLLNTKQVNSDNGFVVTPLTTLVATTDDNSTIETIAKNLGFTNVNDLFKDPREVTEVNATNLAQKVNAIFIQAVENGSVVNKINFINTVQKEIKDINSSSDLNFTKIVNAVNEKAQDDPDFFGFVVIPNTIDDSTDILSDLHQLQHPTHLSFVGFVFDKNFQANITILDQNGTKIADANATSDEFGHWTIEDTSGELNRTIYGPEQILTFEAIKTDNPQIVLKSSISTVKLKELIEKQKRVSASKDNSLIISNITTAEHGMLDKRGVFEQTGEEAINAYDNNKTDIKIYYNDILLTAAATIKAVVDGGEDLGNATNTYDLVTQNLEDNATDYKIPDDIDTQVVNEQKTVIYESPILSTQLYSIDSLNNNGVDETVDDENITTTDKITLKNIAEKENYTFYRLFAYDKDPNSDENNTQNLVRIYQKYIVAPGGYIYQEYRIDGNDTRWNLVKSFESNASDFKATGDYVVSDNSLQTVFIFDKNNSAYSSDTNKTYSYYNIIKMDYNNTQLTKTSAVIWVNDFDIVDAFRRLTTNDYNQLWDIVKGIDNNDTINAKINRNVEDYINKIDANYK